MSSRTNIVDRCNDRNSNEKYRNGIETGGTTTTDGGGRSGGGGGGHVQSDHPTS